MSNLSRELVQIFAIRVPRCSLTYSTAPCAAVLGTTGNFKCFNCFGTCQDTANISLTEMVEFRFAKKQARFPIQYGPLIPSLVSLSTTPLEINLGGMDKSAAALGRRESISVVLQDHDPLMEHLQDKYRAERYSGAAQADGVGYDPYKRGTFWGKWLARNPYYTSFTCVVYDGYADQALEDMKQRFYVLESITGPVNGQVQIKAKDQFSLIERRKAQAPAPSTGTLNANITASQTTAVLAPTGIGDLEYGPAETKMGTPGSGYMAFGDEIVSYTRSGDNLTIARAKLGTTASTHDAGDTVQIVLVYDAQAPHDIIYDLLVNYSEVPAANIDKAAWDAVALSSVGLFTGYIAKPEAVADLVGELMQQAGYSVWPNVATNKIDFKPLRAGSRAVEIDDSWSKEIALKRDESKRVSQVWVYYGQVNPLESLDEKKNYQCRLVIETDGADLYGTESVIEIFSRWLLSTQRAVAQQIGDRYTTMFKDPPLIATITTTADNAEDLIVADYAGLSADELQDAVGNPANYTMAIMSIERQDDEIQLSLQRASFTADDGTRVVSIDNDLTNVNLRTLHDTQFPPPVSGDVVRFILTEGVYIGSTSTATKACVSGDWPAGVDVTFEVNGVVAGKGGKGGRGGNANGDTPSAGAGVAGLAGGDAFEATSAVTLTGSGEINGGVVGEGGGGSAAWQGGFGTEAAQGGSGGGSGRGDTSTTGGAAGSGTGSHPYQDGGENSNQPGATGGTGSRTAKGNGGAAQTTPIPGDIGGGAGGAGGDWGAAGSAGSSGSTLGTSGAIVGAGAAGGAAGKAVVGNAFITWDPSNTITVRGSVT